MDVTHPITDDELRAVDRKVADALSARSLDDLNTLGFGELGVPLAWPDQAPALCVKRLLATNDRADSEWLFERVERYVAGLSPHLAITPTELRVITNDAGRWASYLIQPVLAKDRLVENILESEAPAKDHPIVVAVRDACVAVMDDGGVAVDSQFSNFAWDGSELAFFDIGTPFLYDENGRVDRDFGPLLDSMPAILRPLAGREAVRIANELGGRRGNLEHAAISIARMGLDSWIDPVVETFNEVIDNEPLVASDIRDRLSKRHKDMVQLKKIMQLQRAWVTKVRRQPYEYFITDSFTGEIL